ncbi:MAG TPA: hypothetical protein VHH10_13205 [Rubrobacteraceae bacterium]|nr:hypothetical protein [Rubrobacteraceae bacterium]
MDREFRFARRKALLGRIAARLRRRDAASTRLPRFDEVRRISGALGRIHRGMRTVPVKRVLGSVGRRSEFDRGFMPARASVEERWKRIDRAFHRGEELPPVSLYKLGHSYYVLDGHNRVSVARFHGVEWIDAHVTEFRASRPVARRGATTSSKTRGSGAREMMDPYEIIKQHRAKVAREVEENRLAGELRAGRKRRAGDRRSALMWELKRILGRLFKPFGR